LSVPPPESAAPVPARRPPSALRRRLGSVIAIAVLAAIGGLAWYLTHRPSAPPPALAGGFGPGGPGGPGAGGRRAPATTVGVAAATQADIPIVIEALGTVTPAATVTVKPQVGGVLRKLPLREGQLVRAGELLAEIDPRPYEMALMQAVGQRQRDEAQLEAARVTLQRYQTLLQQDSIARQDVDTQASLVRQLEAAIVIDRANEGTARLNLGYTKVVAPISGRLGLRVVDVGNVVAANDSAGIAVITQLAPIDVEFSLPQDRVPELQAQSGATALAATALDRTRTRTLAEGRFLALDNVVDVQTGTVRAKARFANDKSALFPSQFVNLRLNLRTIAGAVVVPVAALRHGSDGDFVWVLQADRTVQMRRVTRGEAAADQVQLTSGLQPGERVITEGGDRLKDGARVTLPADRAASGAAGSASAPYRGASGSGEGRHRRASEAGAR
jgi:membrane fusion protein, multidrug efflux system